jgi:hypothetical protein
LKKFIIEVTHFPSDADFHFFIERSSPRRKNCQTVRDPTERLNAAHKFEIATVMRSQNRITFQMLSETPARQSLQVIRLVKTDDTPETLLISGAAEALESSQFSNTGSVEIVAFEPGTTILRFGRCAFEYFLSLRSISVPSSVEVIDQFCFSPIWGNASCAHLEAVNFEPGSKLKQIGDSAFRNCTSLQFLCLPASVQQIHGRAFRNSGVSRIEIEEGNPFLSVREQFLLSVQPSISLVCYFGRDPNLVIDADIEEIGDFCFCSCAFLQSVGFAPQSRMTTFGTEVFFDCANLVTMLIPPSLITLGKRSFVRCIRLSEFSFVTPSALASIPTEAFRGCGAIKKFVIPSSVTELCERCLRNCSRLTDVSFEQGSALTRVGILAFCGCRQLKSVSLPSSVLYVEGYVFESCSSFSTLIFVSPIRVIELGSFPNRFLEPFDVPDSVEICDLSELVKTADRPVLRFARDSKLGLIKMIRLAGTLLRRVFLQVPAAVLKRLQRRLEFDDSGADA